MNNNQKLILTTLPFLILGLLIFAAYLIFFVNIPEMIVIIQNVNVFIYSMAVLALILEVFLFTLTWQYLLAPLSVKVPLRKTFTFVWVGIFTDLLIPAESISGEIARGFLMSKESKGDSGKVIASLVSHRILGTTTITATLFLGFLMLIFLGHTMSSFLLQIFALISFACVVAFTFLTLICVKRGFTERLIGGILSLVERISRGRFKVAKFQGRIVGALESFYKSLRTFRSEPTKLVLPVLFYVLAWICSISIILLVLISIGYLEANIPILLIKVAVVNTLLVAIKSVPIGVPAEVGIPDIALTTLLSLFGIPLDISAAATLLTRFLTVWLSFLIGFVAVQWVGVKTLMESGVFGKTKNKI